MEIIDHYRKLWIEQLDEIQEQHISIRQELTEEMMKNKAKVIDYLKKAGANNIS